MTRTSHRTENAAELGTFLGVRADGGLGAVPADVASLQNIARRLHRLDERRCNEDLTCPDCTGSGEAAGVGRKPCKCCAGRGSIVGRTEDRLESKARDIAKSYCCRLYVQGDPRGWPLYLIPSESGPAEEDASHYNGRGVAVCPH